MHFSLHQSYHDFYHDSNTHDHTNCRLCVCTGVRGQRLNWREIPNLPEGTLRNWFTSLGSALMAGTEFELMPLEPWDNKNKQTTKLKLLLNHKTDAYEVCPHFTQHKYSMRRVSKHCWRINDDQHYLIKPVLYCYTGINVLCAGYGDSKHSWRQTQTVYTDRAKANHTRSGQRPVIMHTQRETQATDQTPRFFFWVNMCIFHNLKLIKVLYKTPEYRMQYHLTIH